MDVKMFNYLIWIIFFLALAKAQIKSLFEYNINPDYDKLTDGRHSKVKNGFEFHANEMHSSKQLSKRSPPPHAKAHGWRAHNGGDHGPPGKGGSKKGYLYEPVYHFQDPPLHPPFPVTNNNDLVNTDGTPKNSLSSNQSPDLTKLSTMKPKIPSGVFWEPSDNGARNDELLYDIDVRLGNRF
uniref:Uncharacterized protein n=1 Tax=Glossina brevipalpis TaxID=37001 RepID=A0A1A9WMK9_9MUSC